MKIDIFIRRPGDKLASNRDLNIKGEYFASESDSAELIEYDEINDFYGFDWLPYIDDSFIAYMDSQVKKYLEELGL